MALPIGCSFSVSWREGIRHRPAYDAVYCVSVFKLKQQLWSDQINAVGPFDVSVSWPDPGAQQQLVTLSAVYDEEQQQYVCYLDPPVLIKEPHRRSKGINTITIAGRGLPFSLGACVPWWDVQSPRLYGWKLLDRLHAKVGAEPNLPLVTFAQSLHKLCRLAMMRKHAAAAKIQRAWREANCNPAHVVCRARLLREFHDLTYSPRMHSCSSSSDMSASPM
jgi:hypothetical protein